MNYKDMSDFDINKAVAMNESLIINESQSLAKKPTGVMVNDILQSFTFDPCNNPSDAWSIITKSHVNLSKHKNVDLWYAFVRDSNGYTAVGYEDKNPLRAAMICFLKMKDAKNETSN